MPYKDPAKRREAARAAQARYRLRHPERARDTNTRCVKANPEANRAKAMRYFHRHRDKLRVKQRQLTAQYRAAKLQRTPSWADAVAIKAVYAACPRDHHVDHIVPLQGADVCGLHVHYNLQHLPAAENMSKGNRYDG